MRIMTSNIWGDYFGNPVNVREDLLFDVFKKYSPDVLGLQEYNAGWYKGEMLGWLSKDYTTVGTELYNNDNTVGKDVFEKTKGRDNRPSVINLKIIL